MSLIFLTAGGIVLLVPLYFEVNTDPQKIGIVGGGAFLIGLLMVSIYSGTLIDFEENRFKEYQSILWVKIGDWQELPKIEKVELIHHTFQSRNTPNGISPTLSQVITIYKCVMLVDGTKFLVLDYNQEKDAVMALEKIKSGLGI
ncbi:hypothetical protein [Algoriphagus pacificus]|uniref:PH domain-containing protein n=1 Tax=Algoriphagus pacificus TaxID=2811234 RepID=A0ABS3CCV3_9BACT|nr:hypothetical protein [Algoriphagus pacificus]MBN7814361.1 hypothetical protein [Algoriphagus pacificus]